MSHDHAAAPQEDSTVQPAVAADATAAVSESYASERRDSAATADPAVRDAAEAPEHEPVETRSEVEVALVRSVRIGPIMIFCVILGAVVAAVAALFFPVSPDATYTLGQAVGFVSLVGAAIGLFLGGVLSLILSQIAKRQSGAARAVLTDVR